MNFNFFQKLNRLSEPKPAMIRIEPNPQGSKSDQMVLGYPSLIKCRKVIDNKNIYCL